jgi:hypothetical protein
MINELLTTRHGQQINVSKSFPFPLWNIMWLSHINIIKSYDKNNSQILSISLTSQMNIKSGVLYFNTYALVGLNRTLHAFDSFVFSLSLTIIKFINVINKYLSLPLFLYSCQRHLILNLIPTTTIHKKYKIRQIHILLYSYKYWTKFQWIILYCI